MLLRHAADRRTVAYLVFTTGLAILQWNLGAVSAALGLSPPEVFGVAISPVLYAVGLFMGVSIAVISHNHNHLGMWRSRGANTVTSWVLTAFYGVPAFAWVPTHNQAHHKLNFAEGDSSRGPKFFKGNHLLSLLVYPTLAGRDQMPEIIAYVKELWRKNRTAFWHAISELIVFGLLMLTLFALDWKKTLIFFVIPQQFALFMVQVFNYVQHVEADIGSTWNHSRNFVSPVLNALLFNNGFHTIHHEKPGIHWSETPQAHAEVAHHIHPDLLVKSWWAYMTLTFLVRPFLPRLARPPDFGHSTGSTPASGAAT